MNNELHPLYGSISELHRIREATGRLVPVVAAKPTGDQVPIKGDIFSMFVTEGKPPVYVPEKPVLAMAYIEPNFEDRCHLHTHSYELYITMGPWFAAFRTDHELRVVNMGEPGFILFPPRVPHRIKLYAPAFAIIVSLDPGKPAAEDRVPLEERECR